MIKKFNEYSINENLNGFQKGDVVEVVSMFGEPVENLNKENAKYIGRIYVVDDSDEHRVKVLGGGTWMISDVRKLSPKEIEKRQPEIQEIYNSWEKEKSEMKERHIGYIKNDIQSIGSNLNHIDSSIRLEEETTNDQGERFKITLNIEKLD